MSEETYNNSAFRNHPKIKQARKLILEAELDIRRKSEKKIYDVLCSCGHYHDEHGPSYSVNYSAGVCKAKKCKCIRFNT